MPEEIHTGGLKKFVRKGEGKRDLSLEKAVEEGYEKARIRKKRNRIILIITIITLIVLGLIILNI